MSEEIQRKLSLEKRNLRGHRVMFMYMKAGKKTVEINSSPHPEWRGKRAVILNFNR